MAVLRCNSFTDRNEKEKTEHGTALFPVGSYYNDMSQDTVPWHWHEEMEAGVVIAGSLELAAGTDKYILGPGQGFFVNAGVYHGAWDHQGSNCQCLSIVFHPRLVGGSVDSVFWQNYLHPLMDGPGLPSIALGRPAQGKEGENAWQRDGVEAIRAAWEYCKEEKPGYEFQVRNALSQLIFLLRTHILAKEGSLPPKAVRDGERIKAMLRFIQESYGEELDTRRIAASAMISESECLRCFHSTLGVTPIQYVRQYRIQKAAELLAQGGQTVADVGARCGFKEMSYFARTFREMKGMTPSQYRREKAR